MDKKLVIAIDGHSSCGKSTFAKRIAEVLNYLYIDSGAMYRAATYYALKRDFLRDNTLQEDELIGELDKINIEFRINPQNGLNETWLNGENIERAIRTLKVSQQVSPVSKVEALRYKLVEMQRSYAGKQGVVMDGRDIGTVVFPNADLKIFMTASPMVRAQRRYDELKEKGMAADFEEVLKNIESRDHQDSTRNISPLRKADDAILLDNSQMTPDEQMVWFNNLMKVRFGLATDE